MHQNERTITKVSQQHYTHMHAHTHIWSWHITLFLVGPVQADVTHNVQQLLAELYKFSTCETVQQTCSGLCWWHRMTAALCWLTPCRVRCHSSAFYSKDITKTDYLAEDWAFLITQSGLLVQIYPIIFAVISSEVTVCCDSPVNGLGLWWIVVITMTVGGCTAGDNSLSALPVREDLNKLIGRSWRLLCILSPEHYTNRNTNKIMCTLEVCLFNTWSSYYVLKFLLSQRWKASLQKIKYKHLENIQKIV